MSTNSARTEGFLQVNQNGKKIPEFLDSPSDVNNVYCSQKFGEILINLITSNPCSLEKIDCQMFSP